MLLLADIKADGSLALTHVNSNFFLTLMHATKNFNPAAEVKLVSAALGLEHELVSPSSWPSYGGPVACLGKLGPLEGVAWAWALSWPGLGNRWNSSYKCASIVLGAYP